LEKKKYDKWVAGLLFFKKWMSAEDVAEKKRQSREWIFGQLTSEEEERKEQLQQHKKVEEEEHLKPSINDLGYTKTKTVGTRTYFKRVKAVKLLDMA